MSNRDMKNTTQKVNTAGTCFLSRCYSRVGFDERVLTIVNYQLLLLPPIIHIR